MVINYCLRCINLNLCVCVCVLGDMVQKMVALFAEKSFYDEELLCSEFKSYFCERNGEYMHEGKKIEINEG